jgi:UDP-N-acetylmuramoyl-tripeptide--D-alanyl-D-alanine ligase
MRAALRALVDLAGGRRTWAVLGEMRELGPDAAAEHAAIGQVAGELGVDRVVLVGEGARAISVPGLDPVLVADVEGAAVLLREGLAAGDVVLVKASRAAGLERVAAALLAGEATP